jgi:hypothetical protein
MMESVNVASNTPAIAFLKIDDDVIVVIVWLLVQARSRWEVCSRSTA